ncbi:MAG: amidohydrolase family protein, partial [Spirochaetia bacterium]|nr:amidohydrolase family protein [Spirochaetia bacterium]
INIMDMHEMMVHAAYLIRTANLDRNLLPNKEVLEMATMNGARALGMDKEIGSLEKNKKADLIMVDLKDKLTTAPLFDVWEAAAFGARGSDVEMVMVNGDIKVRDYEVKNVDATELIREAERVAVEYKEKILSTPVADSWELTTI